MYRVAKRENESASVRIEGNRFGIALVLTSRVAACACHSVAQLKLSVMEIFVNTSAEGWYGTPAG